MVTTHKKKLIVMIMQYTVPDYTPNSIYAIDLAYRLKELGYAVEIWAGKPKKHLLNPSKKDTSGIVIRRFWHPNLNSKSVIGRLVNSFFVSSSITFRLIFLTKSALLWSDTSSAFIGLASYVNYLFRRTPYVYSATEIYPDTAIKLGNIGENGLIAKMWRFTNRLVYNNARKVRVIGESERDLVKRYLKNGLAQVARDWPTLPINDTLAEENVSGLRSSKKHPFATKFVLMHTGSVGRVNDLSAIFKIAKLLENDERFVLVFVGLSKGLLEAHKPPKNCVFLDYQTEAEMLKTICLADMCLLSLKPNLGSMITPSRIYNAMLAGQALLALIDHNSTTAKIIEDYKLGVYRPQSGIVQIKQDLEKLCNDRSLLETYKRNARNFVLQNALKEHGLEVHTKLCKI